MAMTSIGLGERVLVTGGTGSLGEALLAELTACGAQVRVLSRDEKKQGDLRARYPKVDFRLGDVRDAAAVGQAMEGIDVVIHAASLKYVDVGEQQPAEYVKTNVLGTLNVLEAVRRGGVPRCVGVSTDKVSNAVNTYGHTKALLERMFLEAAGGQGGGHYVVARYGNVIGSRGSVVPKWIAARHRGEPLVMTDPSMTRFVFTLAEAVTLIDHALGSPNGAVVAIPLPACDLAQLARVLAPGHPTRTVGARPGEKRHEELLTVAEMERTVMDNGYFLYDPSLAAYREASAYTSDRAPRLTDDELGDLLKEWR